MKILTPEPCDDILGAPADMAPGECEGLPVQYQHTENGTFAISLWMPDPLELAALAGGAGLALWVRAQGRQHPVVALSVFSSSPDFDFVSGEDAIRGALLETARLRAENDQLRAMLATDMRNPQ